MAKYIVEAPDLKRGQKISTGGVRENGKLASLFSNPVPYQESPAPLAVRKSFPCQNSMAKQEAKEMGIIIAFEFVDLLWTEVGRPAVKAKFHQLGQQITSSIQSDRSAPRVSQGTGKKSVIIDVETTEINDLSSENDSSIIRFPKERVG